MVAAHRSDVDDVDGERRRLTTPTVCNPDYTRPSNLYPIVVMPSRTFLVNRRIEVKHGDFRKEHKLRKTATKPHTSYFRSRSSSDVGRRCCLSQRNPCKLFPRAAH